MVNVMVSPILITVHLKGALKGPIPHKHKQKHSVKLSPEYGYKMTSTIKHSNRYEQECYRKTLITSEVVQSWVNSEAPMWESPRKWARMKEEARIQSYVNRFDEGFGVSSEVVQ